MSDVFVGRQPIYDRQMNVVAYELLFRNGGIDRAEIADGDRATCNVLANALVEIGLQNVCGSRPAFINFTRGFLEGRFPIPFERERIVIEVLENIVVDEPLLESLRELKAFGFQIALDDFTLTPESRPLLEVADIVKLDVLALSQRQIAMHIAELRRQPIKLLAEKIETPQEFERCNIAGFDLFQGYFLSRPELVKGRQIPKNRLAVMQLLAKLQDPEVDFHDLEQLVRVDVTLTVRLLQLVNSSSFGLSRKVDSIHHALVMLGMARVRNLVTLLKLAGLGEGSTALLGTALVRAKMSEQLGSCLNGNRDAYFTVGLLSALDLFMQAPLDEILKALPLSEDLVNALLRYEGGMGSALKCVLAYEQGAGASAECLALKTSVIGAAYLAALAWVDGSGGMLEELASAKAA